MRGSIVYFISFSVLLILLFNYKKNEKKVNGFSYFIFCFLLVWCYEAVGAGLLNLFSVPINLFSVAICNIVATATLWILHKRNGMQKQQYYWECKDFIVAAVITIATLVIAYSRFGGWFEVFRFKSGDGSIHLMWAEEVVRTGKINSMYFQKLRDSLMLMFITPFLGTISYYKVFLAFQTFLFALSGITFWALIEDRLNSLPRKIVGAVLTIVYMLGYPLNNMMYGFTYWGTSILLIAFIIYLFKVYRNNNISFNQLMIVAFFANTALCVCYVYFAPVVFGCQFLFIWGERKGYWKEKILYTVFPLFLAGVLCIVYVYFGIFSGVVSEKTQVAEVETAIEVEDATKVEDAVEVESTAKVEISTEIETGAEVKADTEVETSAELKTEPTPEEVTLEEWDGSITTGLAINGLSYYDLYSNFVLLIPFILLYFWNVISKRKTDEYTLMTILTVGIQFILYLMGYISLYYYNKNYNLLWLLCFAIMARVIADMDNSQNQFLIAYGIMCSILFAGTLIHVDERLRERDSSMCLDERASAYFDLISANLDTVTDRYNSVKMSPLEQELCNEAAKLTKEGYSVAWVSEQPRFDDFYAITNQIPTWTWDLQMEYSLVENKQVDYALVSRNKNGVYCNEEYVDNQNRVFENAYGYIIEVK